MAESNSRRIILLGKTGSGKSSLANTLFGETDTFKVSHSANSETKLCVSKTKNINGREVQLVDTPGFFNTDLKSTELREETLKCIEMCAPGPHAFLLVLKMGKFTELEKKSVDLMKEYFPEALKYTTVVFTRGAELSKRKMKIEEWVNTHEDLEKLVQECGDRCHVIDNKRWNNDQNQIEELLKLIDKTLEENGGHYIKPHQDELKEEANVNVLDFLKTKKRLIITSLIGALIGALVGAGIGFIWGATGVKVGVVVGSVVGGAVGGGVGELMGGGAAGGAGGRGAYSAQGSSDK